MSVTKLKSVDNKTKLKIFGFSRKSEKELSISIPIMIQYLVMAYYWVNEHFTKHGERIPRALLEYLAVHQPKLTVAEFASVLKKIEQGNDFVGNIKEYGYQ